ncbi:MAG: hypothetical protein ACYDC3_10085 [Candidatus Binataceae bacterium]
MTPSVELPVASIKPIEQLVQFNISAPNMLPLANMLENDAFDAPDSNNPT